MDTNHQDGESSSNRIPGNSSVKLAQALNPPHRVFNRT